MNIQIQFQSGIYDYQKKLGTNVFVNTINILLNFKTLLLVDENYFSCRGKA